MKDYHINIFHSEEDAESREGNDYGQRYVIDLEVTGPTATVQVRSAWIIRHEEDFPRFVSCYVL